MYRLVCYTCERDELFDEFEAGQSLFTDHVDRGHAVELHRLDVDLTAADASDVREAETECEASGADTAVDDSAENPTPCDE